uniref:F-box domain-containing protein n=1 Tax=Mycena chlorophos TaxID=658473 RepID=A0ABQ0L651_MYCCL|nr:predicted protein [Mycena chlorophos]
MCVDFPPGILARALPPTVLAAACFVLAWIYTMLRVFDSERTKLSMGSNIPAVADVDRHGHVLPTDLLQDIFERVAVDSKGKEIGNLLLIARMAKLWIEPLRFRVVRLDGSRRAHFFVDTIYTSERIARGVHHILLPSYCGWTIYDVFGILRRCPNIQGLGLMDGFDGPAMLPLLATVAPRRLTATLSELFRSSGQINPSHPALAQITHLWLFDGEDHEDASPILRGVCEAATLLPSLTHLQLQIPDSTIMAALQDQLQDLLNGAPHLCCLLLRVPDTEYFGMDVSNLANTYQIADPRLVLLRDNIYDYEGGLWEDWTDGALGGDDLWALADDFLSAKRAKYVSGAFLSLVDHS